MAVENGASTASTVSPALHRILFLDAYDSYTNNIISLLKQVLGNVRVDVRHIDLSPIAPDTQKWTREDLIRNLKYFDAVVCGPGPGSPLNPADVGAFEILWSLAQGEEIPVLGICLGFQSLVCNFGGKIRKLKRGLHGMVRDIDFQDGDIFSGVQPFRATLYHSLCADIGQDAIPNNKWLERQYSPAIPTPHLIPLAWTTGHTEEGEDERILMAVKHANKPFWGLQYHPESVCTEANARSVLRNWWAEVHKWNQKASRASEEALSQPHAQDFERLSHVDRFNELADKYGGREMLRNFPCSSIGQYYSFDKVELPEGGTVTDIAELLGQGGVDTIILDSSSSAKGDPLAKHSIIALDVDREARIMHRAGDTYITVSKPSEDLNKPPEDQKIHYNSTSADQEFSPWQFISKLWHEWMLNFFTLPHDAPAVFKGGLMGYVTYESGLDALSQDTIPKQRGHDRPDICLAIVTKSVVIDHQAGLIYVQILSNAPYEGREWCRDMVHKFRYGHAAQHMIKTIAERTNGQGKKGPKTGTKRPFSEHFQYDLPKPERYKEKVRQCQDAIREGNSYELCLTGKTFITQPKRNEISKRLRMNSALWKRLPAEKDMKLCQADREDPSSPWNIYKTLRSRQPAPFGSFIRLGGATLLSASPERFLKYNCEGVCSMRPMKGTVRKSEQVSTLAQAETILHIPKEEAENLMIVDLVRHDLHGICGAGRVTVPELLKVEEYATVFQMVTNVEGHLPKRKPTPSGETLTPFNGLDVLSSVLPPGSMTGAPKKRSCEILHELEGGIERSLYSGVVGYMDISGKGDWSVTIRSMFKWDDEIVMPTEGEREERERWHIGAGGAVTILSTPEGEYDEMVAKLQGPLNVLREVG